MQTVTDPPQPNRQDEIDLFQLFIKILRFCKKYYKLFIIVLIVGILFILGAYFIWKLKPKTDTYSASMVIKTGFQPEEILEVLNPVSHYVQNKDIKALTQLMDITYSEANILNKFSAGDLGMKENNTSPGSNIDRIPKDLIKIDIGFSTIQTPTSTFNPRAYLANIRQGVLHCIWSNAYVREKDSSIQADYKNLIIRIDDQIAKLNSAPLSVENVIITKTHNQYETTLAAVELAEKRSKTDSLLKFMRPVFLVQDFIITDKETSFFMTKKKIALYLFGFLMLGLVWALAKEMKSILVKENLN